MRRVIAKACEHGASPGTPVPPDLEANGHRRVVIKSMSRRVWGAGTRNSPAALPVRKAGPVAFGLGVVAGNILVEEAVRLGSVLEDEALVHELPELRIDGRDLLDRRCVAAKRRTAARTWPDLSRTCSCAASHEVVGRASDRCGRGWDRPSAACCRGSTTWGRSRRGRGPSHRHSAACLGGAPFFSTKPGQFLSALTRLPEASLCQRSHAF